MPDLIKLSINSRGFTIMEVMLSSFLGLVVLSVSFGSLISNRGIFRFDLQRSAMNQNLRGSLDFVGTMVREAGENLPSNVPAVEIIDGNTNPDQMILRRNLIDQVLKVCQEIESGSATNRIYFALNGSPDTGCIRANNLSIYDAWRSYRLAHGGTVKAFLYNIVTHEGEFVDYSSETDTGADLYIQKDSGTFLYDYPVNAAAVYIIEEWHFRIGSYLGQPNYLQVIENGDMDNILNVMFGIQEFNVTAILQDNTTQSSFDRTNNWKLLRGIRIRLGAQTQTKLKNVSSQLEAEYFPRNILSD
ncbi:hypothetical protein JNK13_05330 [bacterium]|nr:hypothetical protein [bacterium]